jgi:type VI secretion system secreted protein Hcp
MAYDAFLKIDDVEGDVTVAGHEGEIEIMDFSFGVENPLTIGSATTGAGAGKATFDAFSITKSTDRSSPVFFKNCVTGAHFNKAVLSMRKAGGSSQSDLFIKFTFSTVFVGKVDWAGADDGGDAPEEQIDFVYGEIQIYFTDADGTVSETGWDITRNAPA